MIRKTQQLIIGASFPLLFAFIIFGLLNSSGMTGMIVSDSSYKSPQSDNSYISPQAGDGLKEVKSDNDYNSAKSDNGFKSIKSDEDYKAPVSGEKFVAPTIGEGFKESDSPQKKEEKKDEKQYGKNSTEETEDNRTEENTDDIIISLPEVNESLPRGPIDTSLVGRWRLYSESVYYTDGEFEFAETSNAELTLRRDSTWTFGRIRGTWQVLPIIDTDWERWGIKNTFTQKLVLHNWENSYADGPIEETSFGAKYLWAVFDASPPRVMSEAQIWDKFSPAPAREGDNTFSELNLVGRWRVKEQAGSTGTLLVLTEDHAWRFKDSAGTWEASEITDDDRKTMLDSDATHKILLDGGKRGKGTLKFSGGEVSSLTVIFTDENGEDTVSLDFVPLKEDNVFLTVQKDGKGSIRSIDGKISCGNVCSAGYSSSERVEITAVPDEGWAFSKWTGACEGDESTCEIQMSRSKTAKAEFIPGCKSNDECADNEQCTDSRCIKVGCSCGSVKQHSCVKFECCNDNDCKDGTSCDKKLNRCIAKSACREVVINGDPSIKHDIVFVGAGLRDEETLEKGIMLLTDYEGKFETKLGVFSLTPFKENREKFNFWMINDPEYPHYAEDSPVKGIGVDTLAVPDDTYYENLIMSCERDTVIIMSPGIFRPWANFPTAGASGGRVFMSLNNPLRGPQFLGRTLAHEMAHAIGGLADEYVEFGGGDRTEDYDLPNCASNILDAEKKWGDLVDVRGVHYYTGIEDVEGTIYYKHPIPSFPEIGFFPDGSDWGDGGCAYVHKNIRPTISSIMGSHYTLENDFGPVNERVISERLAVYPSKEEPNINENNLDNSIQPSGGRGRIFLEDAG